MRRNESDYGTGLRSFLIIECSEVISYPNLFTVYLPSNLFTATKRPIYFAAPSIIHLLSIYYPSIMHLLFIFRKRFCVHSRDSLGLVECRIFRENDDGAAMFLRTTVLRCSRATTRPSGVQCFPCRREGKRRYLLGAHAREGECGGAAAGLSRSDLTDSKRRSAWRTAERGSADSAAFMQAPANSPEIQRDRHDELRYVPPPQCLEGTVGRFGDYGPAATECRER
jgi:hypothetical protein